MVLRSKLLLAIAASIFVIFHGDFAAAEKKGGGRPRSGERTKPRSTPSTPKANAPAQPAPAPAPATVKTVSVCVRPEGVDDNIQKWTYGETNKLVVSSVESTAQRLHNWIYTFDKNADLDSPAFLPMPHRQLKCPNDKRKHGHSAGKSSAILPPSAPLFTSPPPLGPSSGFLAPSSLGSSGTGKSPSALVDQFVQASAQFQMAGNQDESQATRFAHNLHDSITMKTTMAEIAPGDLTPNAATILANAFGESLAAAMAQQSVIGPLNVLQKMVPSGKNAGWNALALVNSKLMADREIIEPDDVPAVVLSIADHQQRMSVVASLVPGELPAVMLHRAYKQAYADKPAWIASIAAYF